MKSCCQNKRFHEQNKRFVEDESSWTYEGLRDVGFSNNDNLNEVVFEDVIVTLDVKGENFGVKDTKNHNNKA
jgi:hypothetical protein